MKTMTVVKKVCGKRFKFFIKYKHYVLSKDDYSLLSNKVMSDR